MNGKRQHLHELGDWLRSELQQQGLETAGASQIVPVMIGDSARAVAVAEQLRQHRYWITAVRPPTVAPGTSRLRLSVTAVMNEQQLSALPEYIAEAVTQA
jgi:8-amino-7-oxononanoate synthase